MAESGWNRTPGLSAPLVFETRLIFLIRSLSVLNNCLNKEFIMATKKAIAPEVKEALNEVKNEVVAEVLSGNKKWYLSKTVWVNVLAAVAVAVQSKYGFVVPLEYQAGALSVVNLALRKITKSAIEW